MIATFHRSSWPKSNDLVAFCSEVGLQTRVIEEGCAFDLRILPAIRTLISSYRPDVIETHSVKSHFLMRLTRARGNSAWIAFHHGYTWSDAKVRVYNMLDRWSLPSASQVITDCRPFAEHLRGIGVDADRITVMHSCINQFTAPPIAQIGELRRTLRVHADTAVIMCIGRLSREKGQSDLIEAIALLLKTERNKKICVVVAGDGPDREMLIGLAKQLNVFDSFRFVGHVANVAPFYRVANLLVLPSHSEGSPNVLLEAMAASTPIVATSVGGIPEIVTNGREALIVPSRNPFALAQSIERLLHNKDLANHLAASAHHRSRQYSPDAYCHALLSVYEQCLGRTAQGFS